MINFIEYLKISYVDTDAPDNIMIKSKKDLKEKLQKAIYDHKSLLYFIMNDKILKGIKI